MTCSEDGHGVGGNETKEGGYVVVPGVLAWLLRLPTVFLSLSLFLLFFLSSRLTALPTGRINNVRRLFDLLPLPLLFFANRPFGLELAPRSSQ